MNGIYSIISFIIPQKQISKTLNLILKNSLSYIKAIFLKNDDLKIIIYSSDYDKYNRIFFENNIDIKFLSEKGIFAFLRKNKHRVGLVIGIIIIFCSILLSSKFVWNINISGNERMSDNEVINELKNAGFNIGSFIPAIDYKDLHNRILLNSNSISWISINITGNIANVSIKERLAENEKNKEQFSNIIASSDGQIALVSVIEGKKQISIGDVVQKGDILISGVIDSQSEGVRYVDAKGEVMAYVNKTVQVKIPYSNTKKVLTNNVYDDKKYKIFNNYINFSIKYRNHSEFCDTIEKTEQIKLFNKIALPIYCITTSYYEYEYQNFIYSKEQAVNIAFKELRGKMDNELKNAELISKSVTTSYDDKCFYVICELYCLENIASSVEFYVENYGG